ncbi:hypothetical protein [Roseiterribacter gracilis]|uniref:Uncharacterized protein n=1 Tax=Roseiterribacter gracilis TaxID=2812848 RepID=A0A8S8XHL5_9PROT|nr:hypothetical protein TMPK1_32840 [Rhodospirillales bacterium TMPK1]
MSEFDDFVARKRAEIEARLAEQRQRETAAAKEAERIASLVQEFRRVDQAVADAAARLNRKLEGIGVLSPEEAQERNTPDGAIAHIAARYKGGDAKPNEYAVLRFDLRKDNTVAAFIVASGPKKGALDMVALTDCNATWIERALEKFVQAVA